MRYNILPWNILIRIFMFNSIHLTVRFLRDMHITNPKRSMFYYTRKIYEMRKPHTSLNHQWLQKGGLFLKMQWLQIRNKNYVYILHKSIYRLKQGRLYLNMQCLLFEWLRRKSNISLPIMSRYVVTDKHRTHLVVATYLSSLAFQGIANQVAAVAPKTISWMTSSHSGNYM